MLSDVQFIYHLIIAIGLGGLIGLEREHHRTGGELVLAGARSFPLVALLGFLTTYLAQVQPWLQPLASLGLPIIAAVALGLMAVRYLMGSPGITTPLALIVTYGLGVLVGLDLLVEAVAVAVVVTLLLISSHRLHSFAEVLDDREIIAALQFIAICFIMYPLTANLNLAPPYNIFNQGGLLDVNFLLLLVIFVSSISFASFLLIRYEGPNRGLRFSGLLGGLVNSEATTASLCEMAKAKVEVVPAAISGIFLTNGMMYVRNLAIVAFTAPTIGVVGLVSVPLLALCAMSMAFGVLTKGGAGEDKLVVKSPFAIGPAIKFAVLFLLISAATILLKQYVGTDAVYIIAIGGLVSSAAVAASVAAMAAGGTITVLVAAQTIMLACTLSTVNKLLISRTMNSHVYDGLRLKIMIMTVVSIILTAALFVIRI
ncbi:MAG: MgtC/SapB family protein [Methanomassiliicoccales archaeon]